MAGDISLVEVMARLVAAFALIIGLLGGAVWLFRRRGMLRVPGSASPTRRMHVVERQSISRSASVAVVRVGSSSYLIGATDTQVSLLADVSATIREADEADRAMGHGVGTDLAHQGTGAQAGAGGLLQSPRMDLVGAILQRMHRRD